MQAQCYCGKVKLALGDNIISFINCHCSMCRRLNGSAYTSWLCVSTEHFLVTQGAEAIKNFAVTECCNNAFCGNCGTRVYTLDTRYPNVVGIQAGIVDDVPVSPVKELYYSDGAKWACHQSDLPKFGGENGCEPINV